MASAEHIMMTDKHKKAITKNIDKLASNLTKGVLNKLVAEDIISIDEQEEVLSKRVSSEGAGVLIRLLVKKEDRAFYVFIEALKGNQMSHLAKLLEDADKDGGDKPDAAGKTGSIGGLMTEAHKQKLETSRTKLKENMDPKATMDKLREFGTFTPSEANEILEARGDASRVGEILDRLLKKPDSAYGDFARALRETRQGHLADLL